MMTTLWMHACATGIIAAGFFSAAAGEAIEFRPTSLPESSTSDFGATATPPAELPPEAVSPPLPPAMPIQGSYLSGVEWYVATGPLATGPLIGNAVPTACSEGATAYWRVGMMDWRACGTLDWDADHVPVPVHRDFVTALGPPPLAAAEGAVWFWRAEIGGAWTGPLGPPAIAERTAALRFESNPDIWRVGFGAWLQAHNRGKSADAIGLPIDLTKDFFAAQDRSSAPGVTPDAAKAAALSGRLAGAWLAKGVLSDGYSTPVLQLVLDPRGFISIKESVMTTDGEILSGADWLFATYAIQVLSDDTALISASFNSHRLPYGYPAAFKFTLLDDGTLRDEWTGVVLTRYAAFPS